MESDAKLGVLISILVILAKIGVSITTPLYLDCLNPIYTPYDNISTSNISGAIIPDPVRPSANPVWQRIDPFFGIWMSMGFDTLLLGTIVMLLSVCRPGTITKRETTYPKLGLLISGGSQAVSALLYQFSTSGTRTAPYLQGVLGYFYLPIAFFLRFLILRKRPTLRKLFCAVVIVLGEVVCLLPTMFPDLESETERRQDGGARGVAGVLWPIVFVFSQVPHAIWSILLEKGAKDKNKSEYETDVRRLNMAYIMFWNFLGTFTTTLLLFWLDLIPGFGLMPNIKLFIPQLWFNLKCIFGATSVCGFHQVFTAWARMISKTSSFVLIGLLVRHAEGANFYAIIVTLVTPLVFLSFTLLDEQTARWHPHATLSTWLSLGALVVMVPAVILYNTGAEEVTVISTRQCQNQRQEIEEEQQVLIHDTSQYGSINSATDTHLENNSTPIDT